MTHFSANRHELAKKLGVALRDLRCLSLASSRYSSFVCWVRRSCILLHAEQVKMIVCECEVLIPLGGDPAAAAAALAMAQGVAARLAASDAILRDIIACGSPATPLERFDGDAAMEVHMAAEQLAALPFELRALECGLEAAISGIHQEARSAAAEAGRLLTRLTRGSRDAGTLEGLKRCSTQLARLTQRGQRVADGLSAFADDGSALQRLLLSRRRDRADDEAESDHPDGHPGLGMGASASGQPPDGRLLRGSLSTRPASGPRPPQLMRSRTLYASAAEGDAEDDAAATEAARRQLPFARGAVLTSPRNSIRSPRVSLTVDSSSVSIRLARQASTVSLSPDTAAGGAESVSDSDMTSTDDGARPGQRTERFTMRSRVPRSSRLTKGSSGSGKPRKIHRLQAPSRASEMLPLMTLPEQAQPGHPRPGADATRVSRRENYSKHGEISLRPSIIAGDDAADMETRDAADMLESLLTDLCRTLGVLSDTLLHIEDVKTLINLVRPPRTRHPPALCRAGGTTYSPSWLQDLSTDFNKLWECMSLSNFSSLFVTLHTALTGAFAMMARARRTIIFVSCCDNAAILRRWWTRLWIRRTM